ncbi:CNNM domain-containing protein [Vulgatibacter sp.]|uniref:CNNM domain-containing protein n=1 Tax=Vulgatibacter sp. TaxID=1971226 RepID=UPI00356991FC
MLLLLLYVGIALSVSFLCSLLEASFLSVQMGELLARKQAGDVAAEQMLELKEHRLDDSIGAILTLNTIAHTIGAALAGAQAARVFGSNWVGAFSAVLTLAILLFTEIIPKTLGTTHAAGLVRFTGTTIRFLAWLLAPVLFVTGWLTRLFARGTELRVSRREIGALVDVAAEQGSLEPEESKVIANVLRNREVLVADVMTPRVVVKMHPAHTTVDELLEDPEALTFSRIPIWEDSTDRVIGYVLQREVLEAVARGSSRERPLRDFLREPFHLPEIVSVESALRAFLGRREQLAIVTDEFGGVSGVVTLEDLVETILGAELVDELDSEADLRAAAVRLRDERLKRMRLAPVGGPQAPSH